MSSFTMLPTFNSFFEFPRPLAYEEKLGGCYLSIYDLEDILQQLLLDLEPDISLLDGQLDLSMIMSAQLDATTSEIRRLRLEPNVPVPQDNLEYCVDTIASVITDIAKALQSYDCSMEFQIFAKRIDRSLAAVVDASAEILPPMKPALVTVLQTDFSTLVSARLALTMSAVGFPS